MQTRHSKCCPFVVQGENNPAQNRLKGIVKAIDFKWNRWLWVEISGIKPLTSWMPFAPWQVCHSANGGFTFKTLNFCNLLHIVFWVYFNLLSNLLSKTFGQQRYSRTHQSFKYATPCFISKRGSIRLCTSFEYFSNGLRWCGGSSAFCGSLKPLFSFSAHPYYSAIITTSQEQRFSIIESQGWGKQQ